MKTTRENIVYGILTASMLMIGIGLVVGTAIYNKLTGQKDEQR